jgi:hypothetical protein
MTEYEKKSLALLCVIADGINRMVSRDSVGKDELTVARKKNEDAKRLIENIERSLKEGLA